MVNHPYKQLFPDVKMRQLGVKFKLSEFQTVDITIMANVKESDAAKVIVLWQRNNDFTAESLIKFIQHLGLGFKAEKFNYRTTKKLGGRKRSRDKE